MRTLLLVALFLLVSITYTQAQCNATFYDGFESGTYSPTWSMGAGLSSGVVTTTNPYSGLYRLEGTGGTSTHLTGFSTSFAAATPSYISWDINPQGAVATNYCVIGDNAVTANNCLVFCYWNGSAGVIRFVSSSSYQFACTAGNWYHIELRNVNFATRTFDIWINGSQMAVSQPMRSSTISNVTQVHLYNFNSGVGIWDNIQIGSGSGPSLSSVVTPVTCPLDSNGAIDLSVSGGTPAYNYLWSNGATTQDLTALPAGIYTVTVTDATPCTTSTSINVIEPAPIVIAPVVTDLSCNSSGDGMVTTNPTGGTPGYTYTWSNGDSTQNTSNLAAGTYSIVVTDNNGCTEADTVTVNEPSAILVTDSIAEPLCNGGNDGMAMVTATGGSPGYSYMWSTGDTTATTGLIAAGTYSVTVTDSSGCSMTDSVIVTEPSSISSSFVVTNALCNGDSNGAIDLSAAGGTPGYTYAWSTGSTSEDLSGLAAGSYLVTITDLNGCIASNFTSVTEPPVINVAANITHDNGSNTGAIDLTTTGGIPGYAYLWSNGATTEDLSGLAAGIYNVTITDANGCTLVQSYVVDLVIGTEDAFALQFTAYPNPFTHGLSVDISAASPLSADLQLMDIQGRILWSREGVTESHLTLEMELSAGVYFLHVRQGDRSGTLKLIRE